MFEKISEAAGADDRGYGMGCAAADYDNDGNLDLVVTNYGANAIYRNQGHGRFADATGRAAVGDTSWSTSAAFLDFDNDGDLDLYVANYVKYDLSFAALELEPYVAGSIAVRDVKSYPHPRNFSGAADVLYSNRGDGSFVDVTAHSGMVDTVEPEGRGLGVVASDFDGDGSVDLYVANDATRNFLYHNTGNGSFREIGALAGAAYGLDGRKEAGMGVDAGDYDNDGDMDLAVTNFQNEPNSLYEYHSKLRFSNASYLSGAGLASLRPLGFGIGFFDNDNDGHQDLFAANGHVQDLAGEVDLYTSYSQQDLLLRNRGPDENGRYRYEDVSDKAGPGLKLERVGRGCAFGDYDNDGDVDILVGNSGQRAALLRNDGGNAGNWLSISVVTGVGGRSSVGARILVRAGDLHQVKEVKGSYSYLSQSDVAGELRARQPNRGRYRRNQVAGGRAAAASGSGGQSVPHRRRGQRGGKMDGAGTRASLRMKPPSASEFRRWGPAWPLTASLPERA